MTAPPQLDTFADRVYGSVEPLAWQDSLYAFALAKLCGSLGQMFQDIEDLARDTPQGPGWSAVLDLQRCPAAWLPWLGQFVGVVIPAGTDDATARHAIDELVGFQRGRPATIKAVIRATLTGQQTVILQERLAGDAYALGVYTINTETPDQAATLAAILRQKPAGIVLTYSTGPPNTYEAVRIGYATYADVTAAFRDYAHLAANQPG